MEFKEQSWTKKDSIQIRWNGLQLTISDLQRMHLSSNAVRTYNTTRRDPKISKCAAEINIQRRVDRILIKDQEKMMKIHALAGIASACDVLLWSRDFDFCWSFPSLLGGRGKASRRLSKSPAYHPSLKTYGTQKEQKGRGLVFWVVSSQKRNRL